MTVQGLTAHVDCPKCGGPMPVEGVADLGHAYLTVRCRPCGYAARLLVQPQTGREDERTDT